MFSRAVLCMGRGPDDPNPCGACAMCRGKRVEANFGLCLMERTFADVV